MEQTRSTTSLLIFTSKTFSSFHNCNRGKASGTIPFGGMNFQRNNLANKCKENNLFNYSVKLSLLIVNLGGGMRSWTHCLVQVLKLLAATLNRLATSRKTCLR